jgi:hypothetical protein
MNTKGIEDLLDKFYEGNTTLQEEHILRDFFRNPDVPGHLKSHQKMFSFFLDEQQPQIDDPAFEQKLTALLTDQPVKILPISSKANRNNFIFITSIAATILLLIGLFVTYNQDVFKKEKAMHATANQELAFAEASEALLIVSSNLNAGLMQVEHLQMVDKAMKNIQLFDRFYQYQSIIINPDEIQQKSINPK